MILWNETVVPHIARISSSSSGGICGEFGLGGLGKSESFWLGIGGWLIDSTGAIRGWHSEIGCRRSDSMGHQENQS